MGVLANMLMLKNILWMHWLFAKGFGLKSICDRLTSCNGKIDISTSPGKGTETTIELKTVNV
jgi:signal transduction histidine kinase